MYRITRFILIATVILSAYCLILLACMIPWVWLAIAALAVIAACKKGYQYTAMGTARWSDEQDLRRAGMLGGNGLCVGYVEGSNSKLAGLKALFSSRLPAEEACQQFLAAFPRKLPRHLVGLSKAVHTAVFAPTGVGKGVSVVIPHLLTSPDSMVVVDFKGENAKITAEARRKMGHKIVILDPFRVVTQTPDTFNPFDSIHADDPLAIDEVRDLAAALVVRTGEQKEPQWDDSAEIWIAAMAACVIQYGEGENRSLQTMRLLLTDPQKMQKAIELMCSSPEWEGMLARMGHGLTRYVDRELGSVLTTTNRHLRFLDTIAVAASTKSSSFDPADLYKTKMTVYLVIPPQHMTAQTALLRMWIGSFLMAVVKGGLQNKNKVTFILDEAASLGHMDVIESAVDKFRGYGIGLIFLYQSLGQLLKCFPKGQEQTLLSNVTQVFFGVNDQQTAEYVSARLGEETIIVASGGTSSGTSTNKSQRDSSTGTSMNINHNWAQQGRKLLKPEEVVALPERIAVTFTPGVPPIWTRLVRYYEDGFGKKPDRFWPAVKALGEAVCFLVTVGLFAVVLTGVAGQQRVGVQAVPAPQQEWQLK